MLDKQKVLDGKWHSGARAHGASVHGMQLVSSACRAVHPPVRNIRLPAYKTAFVREQAGPQGGGDEASAAAQDRQHVIKGRPGRERAPEEGPRKDKVCRTFHHVGQFVPSYS